jgi:environmental stress-induced protein Ves
MRIIRAAECRRMPWKNGGGETTEIAVSPPGASLDDFHWRISMAHVATPGPFSIFPGIDRTLAVLDGAGIVLHPAARGSVRLTPDAAPFAFPGDLKVDAKLVGGAIDDLNVMTRRGRYRHLLSRLHPTGPTTLPCHGDLMIVVAWRTGERLRVGAQRETLGPRDAVVLDRMDGSEIEMIPDADAELFVIDLWRG